MPLVNEKDEIKPNPYSAKKCSQLIMYFITTDSTYVNMNMRTILGPENFKIGDTYNLILRAQMNDVAAIGATQTANHFVFNSNAMRFRNTETPVGQLATSGKPTTYATFPAFYNTTTTCNVTTHDSSCVHTFILEAETANMTIQMQSQANNTYDTTTVYPNYLLMFDIYKCSV